MSYNVILIWDGFLKMYVTAAQVGDEFLNLKFGV